MKFLRALCRKLRHAYKFWRLTRLPPPLAPDDLGCRYTGGAGRHKWAVAACNRAGRSAVVTVYTDGPLTLPTREVALARFALWYIVVERVPDGPAACGWYAPGATVRPLGGPVPAPTGEVGVGCGK